jgi:hypothetical protein
MSFFSSFKNIDFNCDENGNYKPLEPGCYVGTLTSITVRNAVASSARALQLKFSLPSGNTIQYDIWSVKTDGKTIPSFPSQVGQVLIQLGVPIEDLKSDKFKMAKLTSNGEIATIGSWLDLIDNKAQLNLKLEKQIDKRTGFPSKYCSVVGTSRVGTLVDVPPPSPEKEEIKADYTTPNGINNGKKGANKRAAVVIDEVEEDNNNNTDSEAAIPAIIPGKKRVRGGKSVLKSPQPQQD